MKRLYLALAFTVLTAAASYGTSITYDTVQSIFNCTNSATVSGCNTTELIVVNPNNSSDGVVLYYQATPSVTVDPNPSTFANLGTLLVGCLGGGIGCSYESLPTGLTLAIEIDETAPDALSGDIPLGNLTGAISGTSSGAFIAWGPNASIQLNGATADVTYAIQNPFLTLPAPSSNTCVNCPIPTPAGSTSIQAEITAVSNTNGNASLPEPGISLMVAAGLLALGTLHRRRA